MFGFGGMNHGLPEPKVFSPAPNKTPLVRKVVESDTPKEEENFVLPEMDPQQLTRFNNFKATFERSLDKHTELNENSRLKCLWMMFEDMPKEYQASFIRDPKLREYAPTLAEKVAALEQEVSTLNIGG